ncbi:MAG TPA: response regulator [Candidatus Omnitrophota bacterium]|nr:response regulator [Candidatus Omnitrophota bacterium]
MLNNLFGKKDAPTFKDRIILVVDDNEVDRKIIVHALKDLGCRVMTAENGAEGYIKALSHKPDLILSDCNMPIMDGVAMCRQIKENEATKDIPVIFLTGVDSPSNLVECFSLDAENFMCKPINPKVLATQIQQVLQEHFRAD